MNWRNLPMAAPLLATLRGMGIGAVIAAFILWVTPADAHHYDHLLAPSTQCGNPSVTASKASQLGSMRCYHTAARLRAIPRRAPALGANSQLAYAADQRAADYLRCDTVAANACGHGDTYWVRRSGYSSVCQPGATAWQTAHLELADSADATARRAFSRFLHTDSTRAILLWDATHRPPGASGTPRDYAWGQRRGQFTGLPGTTTVWTAYLGWRRCV